MKFRMNSVKAGQNWCSWILKHRWQLILVTIVVSVMLTPGIEKLRIDSSNESFLPENDTQTLLNQNFKDIFGNEEFVFLLAESEDKFTLHQLQKLEALQNRVETELPFVKETTSVLNGELLVSDGYMLETFNPFEKDFPKGRKAIDAALDTFLNSPLYRGKLLTPDKKALGIYISFNRIPDKVWVDAQDGFDPLTQSDMAPEALVRAGRISYEKQAGFVPVEDPRKLIAPALDSILKTTDLSTLQVRATGMALLDYAVDIFTVSEATLFGLLTLFITILFLLLLYKSVIAVAGPLLVVLATLLQLFGITGYLGLPLSIMSIIIVPLIFIISVSYSIHVINHYRKEYPTAGNPANHYPAIKHALGHAFWPCLLTALTTSIGFSSFIIVSMDPIRDLGIIAAIGVILTFFLVMILLPILFSFSRKPIRGVNSRNPSKSGPEIGWERWAAFIIRQRKPVLTGFFLLTIVFCLAATRISVETDFLQMMGNRLPIVRQTHEITNRLGAIYSYELMVELPKTDQAKDPQVLKALHSVSKTAEKFDSVQNTMSIADMIRETKSVLTDQNSGDTSLPATREEAAQYLLLYEMSGGEGLDEWVDYDYRIVRLSVQLGLSADIEKQLNTIRVKAEELFPEGSTIALVGDIPVLVRMMDLLVQGQIKSILAALLIISVIMVFVLRSLRGGLISMLPNIFPIISILGVMGLFGLSLDMITVMIAPMIIGIAVDDTVHFFLHFRQELSVYHHQTENLYLLYSNALQNTFARVGSALLFTSIILIAGFSVFGFSRAGSMVHFGILAGVGIAAALPADLMLAPALLMTLRPFSTQRKYRNSSKEKIHA